MVNSGWFLCLWLVSTHALHNIKAMGDNEVTHVIVCFLLFTGGLKTTARWIRDQVATHPEYKQDSVISEGLAYDLLLKFSQVLDFWLLDCFASCTVAPSLLPSLQCSGEKLD